MANLYVVGDSFVSIEDTQHIENDWVKLLAKKLGVKEILNNGVLGSSQDFAFYSLQNWEEYITPDDYVVVALTHPGRFWFFEEEPAICKADHIVHFEQKLGPYRSEAAKLFVQYIQRPELDEMHVENRIAWLSYTAEFRKWRKPLLVYAIESPSPLKYNYPSIKFSKGNLTKASFSEIRPGISTEDYSKVVDRIDPRYNHLCLSNHNILADKIYTALTTDTELDLTTGFLQNILTVDQINNEQFQEKELSPYALRRRAESLETAKKEYNSWRLKSLFRF